MCRLLIEHPPGYLPERKYTFDVLLGRFLGLDYEIQVKERKNICIQLEGDEESKELLLPDIFFQTTPAEWLRPPSLPQTPLDWWKLPDVLAKVMFGSPMIPVIFGKLSDSGYYFCSQQRTVLDIDLFGSCFFMLSRYEELVNPDRDPHGRFPACFSLAYREGFLERPIVNEYLEILWILLHRLWPQLRRKPREYRFLLSHDVDWPISVLGYSLPQIAKSSLGDWLRRKDIRMAMHRMYAYFQGRSGNFEQDPFNTFDWIMQLSETYGLQSSFYFIAERGANGLDGNYDLEDAWMRRLMKNIHERGHEIGLHPSYHSYLDGERTKREFSKLQRIAVEEGIQKEHWGGRQHFLRWENPVTPQNWEDAGLNYDSTLSFADHAGFRCGVCYEYPLFNLYTRMPLNLLERPLIVMEVTVYGYMGLSSSEALGKIDVLNRHCQQFQGDFTLLWHNSCLGTQLEKDRYRSVLEAVHA